MTCAQGLLRLLWGGGPKLECYGTGGMVCMSVSHQEENISTIRDTALSIGIDVKRPTASNNTKVSNFFNNHIFCAFNEFNGVFNAISVGYKYRYTKHI